MSPNEVKPDRSVGATSRVTREQQALAELGTTRYSAGVRGTLVVAFLLTIVAVPLLDTIADVGAKVAIRRQMLAQGADLSMFRGRRPQSLDILYMLPSWRAIASARGWGAWSDLLPKPSRIRAYEDSLVLNSAAQKLIRPWLQWCLTSWLGMGSEKVIIGRDGWLFYADGFDYVTGPGFLDDEQLAQHRSDDEVQADPRKAILQFSDELKRLGILLVVLPVPDKVMIRPASFSAFAQGASPSAQNPSWDEFSADLRQHGIPLLDITREMQDQENSGSPQFLARDSHWSPAGADVAARTLADFLTSRLNIPRARSVPYTRRQIDFTRQNDMVTMLRMPPSRLGAMAPFEHLAAWQVITPSGTRWQPDPSSDILLIGDSFLEMYSIEENGILPAAGLAEQLSYYLQRPIDRMASHQWGYYGARRALGDTLETVRKGALGRKVIVWEFAIRSLKTITWDLMR